MEGAGSNWELSMMCISEGEPCCPETQASPGITWTASNQLGLSRAGSMQSCGAEVLSDFFVWVQLLTQPIASWFHTLFTLHVNRESAKWCVCHSKMFTCNVSCTRKLKVDNVSLLPYLWFLKNVGRNVCGCVMVLELGQELCLNMHAGYHCQPWIHISLR